MINPVNIEIAPQSATTKCFIVLGMHRTASSLVAEGIGHAGVFIGDKILAADSGNVHGYWEDMDFLNMNKRILHQAGGSWDNPPSEVGIMAQKEIFDKPIQKLIGMKKQRLWGWKDPRTTLTINLYLPYIENPHIIACFRSTKQIAESLRKRNNMPAEKAIALANEYNHRLLTFLSTFTGDIN